MILQISLCVKLLLLVLACGLPAAAQAPLESEVRALFTAGEWDRALTVLQQTPNAQTDPALRELLGMAYLYTASRVEATGNIEKAREIMKQTVDQGGKARFFVSRSREKTRQRYLVEAIPGELIVTTGYVEFQAQDGTGIAPERWEKKELTECALNPAYGSNSNCFHLTITRGNVQHDFRPLHFSADESNLICSLIGVQAGTGTRQRR